MNKMTATFSTIIFVTLFLSIASASERPNFILVMSDDQGWGQMGYYGHPVLRTPNLDQMAANGLRLDRFYAGAPNCSPTRATVLTGRSNDRTGVQDHGYPLRLQEKVLSQALRSAGYATAQFGKWHLNGFRGPGVPILRTDTHHPGSFGFDEWLSVSNFFDQNPVMSRMGRFESFEGDSSEIIVSEALRFIRKQVEADKPFFILIWYGSPHRPWRAANADRQAFKELPPSLQKHYGELTAMDRSVGTLRAALRALKISDNTLVWFNSDNGGLDIGVDTVGGLRGFKPSLYEGGLRVPAIIEWPETIRAGRVSQMPASTMDIFPTIAEIVNLPDSAAQQPQDGISLVPLFRQDLDRRAKPIFFRHIGRAAVIDNEFKLIVADIDDEDFELYDLERDPKETKNLFDRRPNIGNRLVNLFNDWNRSVQASISGRDYPEGKVLPGKFKPRNWAKSREYSSYLDDLGKRPEYRRWIDR